MPKQLPPHLATGFEDSESMIDRCIRTKWKDGGLKLLKTERKLEENAKFSRDYKVEAWII